MHSILDLDFRLAGNVFHRAFDLVFGLFSADLHPFFFAASTIITHTHQYHVLKFDSLPILILPSSSEGIARMNEGSNLLPVVVIPISLRQLGIEIDKMACE